MVYAQQMVLIYDSILHDMAAAQPLYFQNASTLRREKIFILIYVE